MWESDVQCMKVFGIKQVCIGEFVWSCIEFLFGDLCWDWLDCVIEVLVKYGLEVVMCILIVILFKWFIDCYDDVLVVDVNGCECVFGLCCYYDFFLDLYYEELQCIVCLLGECYGQYLVVIVWQLDNEYGCYQIVVSYLFLVQCCFCQWLCQCYGSIDVFNIVWGIVFWSMEYCSFDEIDVFVGIVIEVYFLYCLDYCCFVLDEVVCYNCMQVEILCLFLLGWLMVYNFMQMFLEFDYYLVVVDFDVVIWDSYLLGVLEVMWYDVDIKVCWLCIGYFDFVSFNYDLYCGMLVQLFWVMEQQFGLVNWVYWNLVLLLGMVCLWSWEVFFYGVGCVFYFCWCQCLFVQE